VGVKPCADFLHIFFKYARFYPFIPLIIWYIYISPGRGCVRRYTGVYIAFSQEPNYADCVDRYWD
jgi:hypothetical protein